MSIISVERLTGDIITILPLHGPTTYLWFEKCTEVGLGCYIGETNETYSLVTSEGKVLENRTFNKITTVIKENKLEFDADGLKGKIDAAGFVIMHNMFNDLNNI